MTLNLPEPQAAEFFAHPLYNVTELHSFADVPNVTAISARKTIVFAVLETI